MKELIGWILLIAVFIGLFIFSAYVGGMMRALVIWGIAIILALIIFFAVTLITNKKQKGGADIKNSGSTLELKDEGKWSDGECPQTKLHIKGKLK